MSEPWYRDGLRFECTRCGKCCAGFPGYVWVNNDELRAIAEYRAESIEQVIGIHTRFVNGDRSLRDTLKHDCTFWDATQGCTIYPVRPRQCRTWPFWESTAGTPEAWEETKEACPGAGQGTLIPAEEITRRIRVIKL